MKLSLCIFLLSGFVYTDKSIDGLYADVCGNSLTIVDDQYYFEFGSRWSKGKVEWKNNDVKLTGITVYDTVVKRVLPDGTDSLFEKKDFFPIVSRDTVSNRTQMRDISQIVCCGGQLESFVLGLEVETIGVLVITDQVYGECDTLKLKEN